MAGHGNDNVFDELDWDAAFQSVQLVEDSQGVVTGGDVFDLIAHLLTQLETRGRAAYDGEDTFLRRAIASYAIGDDNSACASAFRAAEIGKRMMGPSLFDDDDETALPPLRATLNEAREYRAAGTDAAPQ